MLNESSKYNHDLYNKQRELLKCYLTQNETGKDKFIVLNNEAGFSKSRFADETIINNPERKYILVKKYNTEKYESLEHMKETVDIFWGGEIPNDYVLVINADNSSKYESDFMEDLKSANVVIISLEKYKLLSFSNKLNLYTDNRHTLIIDEYLDVPIVNVNERYFAKRRVLFPHNLGYKEFLWLEDYFCSLLSNYINYTFGRGNMRLMDLRKTHQGEVETIIHQVEVLEQYFESNMAFILSSVEGITINNNPITYLTYLQFFTERKSMYLYNI